MINKRCWHTVLIAICIVVLHGCTPAAPEPKAAPLTMTLSEVLSAKIRCAEEGRKYFEADNKMRQKDMRPIQPTFMYNERLNTCVYESGYFDSQDPKDHRESRFLLDLLTNDTLAAYDVPMDRRKASIDDLNGLAEYRKKHDALFGSEPPSGR